jgi:uncharacterized membrane protein YeiH
MTTPVYSVFEIPFAIEMTAVSFGALSGALHATRKGMDPVGVFTIAIVTSVGGGIIRDVLIQGRVPVFLSSPTYLLIAAFAAVVGVVFARLVRAALPVMNVVDTLLIGVWVVLGAERALYADLPLASAALLGVLTAAGGGIVRDLLCKDVPAIIQPGEWYAAAAIGSSLVFVTLIYAGVVLEVAEVATIATAAGLRVLSLWRGWRTPTAYDVWGDLEARMTAMLDATRRT